jgi:hypothetical protein
LPARAGDSRVSIKSEAQIRELCLGLRPAERMVFPGDHAAQAKARAEFEEKRERLLQTDYLLEIPGSAFAAGDWDALEKVVTLSTERPFRAFGGAVNLFDANREEIEFEAVDEAVDALKKGMALRTLVLAVVFRLADEEGSPCVMGKAKTYAIAVDLVSAELREQGHLLARATRDGFVPTTPAARDGTVLTSAQGAPAVAIKASLDGAECAPEVLAAVEFVKPLIEKCYVDGVARKPELDGLLIIGVEASDQGQLVAGTVAADSVQDAETLACVRAAIPTSRAPAKSKCSVAIQLERR